MNFESGLQLYSIGVVVEDKLKNSDSIKVFPSEKLQLTNGSLTEVSRTYDVKASDQANNPITGQLKGSNFIIAKWIGPIDGNQYTAPNVYKGETVEILRYASTSDFYWRKVGREPLLRKKENVIYVYSNVTSPKEEVDLDNSYWFRVSTIDKLIILKTNQNDKEASAYEVMFNTEKGIFTLTDSQQNYINLDSVNGVLKIKTNKKIELESEEIIIKGINLVKTISKNIKELASESLEIFSRGSWKANAASVIQMLIKTTVTGNLEASEDVKSKKNSLEKHTHKYNPGPFPPTPSEPPETP